MQRYCVMAMLAAFQYCQYGSVVPVLTARTLVRNEDARKSQ